MLCNEILNHYVCRYVKFINLKTGLFDCIFFLGDLGDVDLSARSCCCC